LAYTALGRKVDSDRSLAQMLKDEAGNNAFRRSPLPSLPPQDEFAGVIVDPVAA